MKIFIFFLLLSNHSLAASQIAKEDIVKSCVATAVKKSWPNLQKLEKSCKCTVDKTWEIITSSQYKEKNPEKRIIWYKKFYDNKMTQKEIDEDIYDILEFDFPYAENCANKHR